MRKSIMTSSLPDADRNKEKLENLNFKRIKLRRQKIFTENRMKMIQKSLNSSSPFVVKNSRKNTGNDLNMTKQVEKYLIDLKLESDILEEQLSNNESYEVLIKQKNICISVIIQLRKIFQSDNSSMKDEEDEDIIKTFVEHNGPEILLPFVKFEYFEVILKETMSLLANICMNAGKYK